MAYDAIIAGARGLFFFGGQFKQVMTPATASSAGTGPTGTTSSDRSSRS